MRAYILCFAGALFTTLAVAADVNFSVDNKNIFGVRGDEGRRSIERYVAKLRESEGGLVMIYQDRQVKAELARQSVEDCFIVGSSHVFLFDTQTAPTIFEGCHGVVNLGVSLGGFEDFVAMSGVLARRAIKSRIFIGVSPWMLRANPDMNWTDDAATYERGRSILGLPKKIWGFLTIPYSWTLLFNGDYFLENLQARLTRGESSRTNRSAQSLTGIEAIHADDKEAINLPNGRVAYSREILRSTPPDPSSVGDGHTNIEAPEIDPTVVSEFELAIENLKKEGFEISLLLPPYHPAVMKCANSHVCETMRKVETEVRQIADRLDLRVSGSFDPRPLGLTWRDFIDDMHLDVSGVSKMKEVDVNPWLVAAKAE